MSVSLSAKRSWAFLASAAVGLGSIVSTPVAFADTTTTSVASQTQVHNTADSFTQAETTWGLRDSFRDYLLRGVAQGTQKLARVGTNPKGEYTFGEFDASKSRVTDDGYEIVYTGSKIHYTGHHGVLETIITDFSIIISKDGKGEVRANVQSRPYEGTTPQPLKSYQNIKLGTFDASDLTHDGNNISLAASDKTKVILAEEATPVFASFYDAGQKLDAISFSGRIARGSASATKTSPRVWSACRSFWEARGRNRLNHTQYVDLGAYYLNFSAGLRHHFGKNTPNPTLTHTTQTR